MCSYDSLPVVLVSAADTAAADSLIAEIIDNDVTESYCKNDSGADPVWRLVNKYYTADVRVHTLTDQQQMQIDPDKVEAHVIHLTETECSTGGSATVACAEGRQQRAGAAERGADVRLVAASCVEPDAELEAWAASHHRELVALREASPETPGPFLEQYGVERLRGALHAHAWRGMERVRPDHGPLPSLSRTSSESSEGSAGSAGTEEESVERAEAFVAALGALEAARDSRHGDAARLDRAEQVVAAFCRALGYDLDAC
ncbi:uncharacterized protein LOC115450547 isoform X2 [Manduca sexta]|nr:uncharacterized protein LOC115450547 isoform X2 [Manduca sexta]XP_030034460.1 uncharacterized protein LOC115450547 isoform X2 [Manduca sexta]